MPQVSKLTGLRPGPHSYSFLKLVLLLHQITLEPCQLTDSFQSPKKAMCSQRLSLIRIHLPDLGMGEVDAEANSISFNLAFTWKNFLFGCAGSLLLCWLFSSCGECMGVSLRWLILSRAQALVFRHQSFQYGSVLAVVALQHVGSSQTRERAHFLHWQADSLPLSHQGSPLHLLSIPWLFPFCWIQLAKLRWNPTLHLLAVLLPLYTYFPILQDNYFISFSLL